VIAYHKHNNQPITATYDYFEITPGQSIAGRPSVSASTPVNGATNIARNAFVALDLNLPNVGHGVDAATLTSANVRLVRTNDNSVVPANINTTAGGDAIVLQPSVLLNANTSYTFILSDGLKDTSGAAFLPFSITFTTGTQGGTISPNIAFEKVAQTAATGHAFTSVTMGPDGRLYATTNDGKIIRYNVGADGSLSNATTINTIITREAGPRLVTGLVFHPNATANNLVAYVSHGEYAFEGATDWTGKVTKLSGSSLQTGADLVTGLPRSIRDHLNNQMVFGPDGALYLSQASNSAMGAPDAAWGNRPERLLSAAILRIDLNNIPSTVNVRTEGISNPYNPFAAGAPVTIYASGVRNAYDLLWHSNGFLYAPTNGSAANGNTPASPNPAVSSNRIDQSIFGTYSGPVVPGINKVTATQNDFLFKVEPLGYYGHPNPTRFEWVMNGGNPTSGVDLAEVAQYPVGTQPDRNYRGFAYDFGRNYSPNGVIEFKGNAFGGALDGKILVVRYSGGDDIIVMEPGANGDIVASQTGILGFSGFADPLDLIQDPGTGFLYVAEYGGERITLLRPTSTTGGQIAVDKSNYYFNDVTTGTGHSAAGPAQNVVIRNTGAGTLTITQLTLTGANPSEFTLVNAPTLPLSIAPGQSATIQVAMRATTVGLRSATLRITSSAGNASTLDLSLRGLGTTGTGGDFEPSLQRILDLYQIPINVGDTNPNVTSHYTSSSGPATPNDEVLVQRLQKAGSGPVTVELLANFANTVSPSTKFGWYEAGLTHKKTQLFTVSESDSQSVNPTPNGTTTFDPGTQSFGIYGVFPAFTQREVYSEDVLNQWETNSALRRKVRFYPLKNADGSVVPNAYVFAFEEFTQAFDSNDIVGVIRNVRIADAAPQISFENRTGAPFPDRMVMNRIRELDPAYPNEVWDTNTLRIRNTGNQPLTITSMVINTNNFIFDGYTGGAITIQPNGFYDVKVKFVYNQTGNGISVRTGTLTVNSNDNETPARQVELAGIWQSHSEMTPAGIPIEPSAVQIINALGYKVNILNTGQNINTGGNVTKVGEEVLSPYWMKAEGGNVTVRLLAAYHQQKPTSASTIRWHVSTSSTLTNLFSHRPQQGQSLFPYLPNSTTNPAQASFNPGTNAFGLRVDGTWSDPARNVPNSANDNGHGMRWYIAKDRDGNIIPNTYILCHDYSGVSYSNYDYQDNIYIVTNVRPVNGPSAVVGASASSSGSGIALSWTRNTEGNVAGYRILRSNSANGTYSVVANLVTGTTFTDGTAPVGQTSFYCIVAVDVHGTASSGFGTASATRQSDTTPPATPTGLTASGTASGILLDWANNTDADLAGYNVYRSSTLNGTYTKINASLLTVSELLDATAPSNATSFYRVSAVDTSGNESGFASISAFRPSAGDIPTAPTSLIAIANSQTQITISWTDNNNNETGFRIERRIGNGSFTLLTTVGSNVTNFVDASVGAGTSYTYRVRALGAAGDSAFSNEATAATPQGIPAAPSNLVGNANSASLVTLMWSDNSGNETGFAIERRIGSGGWVRIFPTISNATSYNDTSVTALTSYSYRVIALNDAGESLASNEVVVNTPAIDDFNSIDIGNPTPGGSTTVINAGRDYNVSVGGTDIWGNADSFRFVYKQVTGDFDVKMRIQSVLEVDASMAGLMARADLTAGSANIYVKTRPTGFRSTFRTTAGGTSSGAGGGDFSYPNAWVRPRRVGNTYTAFVSTDGTNWTQHTQQNLNL
ncbi:MAG TPA: choice-of-anchor D domain-containing protein, partial [Tepidisphaeraceae bacterium]|nr:choice-of-anchor D domain-containing protein [Tepidisphaeraceae bacterium]